MARRTIVLDVPLISVFRRGCGGGMDTALASATQFDITPPTFNHVPASCQHLHNASLDRGCLSRRSHSQSRSEGGAAQWLVSTSRAGTKCCT